MRKHRAFLESRRVFSYQRPHLDGFTFDREAKLPAGCMLIATVSEAYICMSRMYPSRSSRRTFIQTRMVYHT